jgi:hypothetical protein
MRRTLVSAIVAATASAAGGRAGEPVCVGVPGTPVLTLLSGSGNTLSSHRGRATPSP